MKVKLTASNGGMVELYLQSTFGGRPIFVFRRRCRTNHPERPVGCSVITNLQHEGGGLKGGGD